MKCIGARVADQHAVAVLLSGGSEAYTAILHGCQPRNYGFGEAVPKPYKMAWLCAAVQRLVEERRAEVNSGGDQTCPD